MLILCAVSWICNTLNFLEVFQSSYICWHSFSLLTPCSAGMVQAAARALIQMKQGIQATATRTTYGHLPRGLTLAAIGAY